LIFETLFERDFAICPIEIINLYHWIFETLFEKDFAICQTGLLTSIIGFLKPSLKGILKVVQ
jgi:hypothetical protein